MVTLLGICSVFLVIVNFTSAQKPCTTPDKWNGTCIVLQQCRPLYNMITGAVTTEMRDFLRRSQCGREGSNPLVCCPSTFTKEDLPTNKHCGVQVSDRIIGGTVTSLFDFPWMALLHYRKPDGRRDFLCGGALIHERYVLTAAHCLKGESITRNRYVLDSIRFGEHDLRSTEDCEEDECADPVVDIPIAEHIVHENYVPTSSSQENDIALIRLQRPAPFTDYIRPICLPVTPNLRNKNYENSPLTVAGFGRTENSSRSDVKLKVDVKGFNLEQCSNIYRNARINLSEKQFCAGGEDGQDSCSGDSGGPLIADDETDSDMISFLVGIVSFGPRTCGIQGFPAVYTRVDQYIEWILDHMRK